MGVCLMCEKESKITREHIIPNWASDVVRELSPNEPSRGSAAGVAAVAVRQKAELRFTRKNIDAVVKGVCHACNSGIEAGVQPLLEAVLRGEGTRLDTDQQLAIASWSYGKALMTDLVGASTAELGRAMREFKRRGRPPVQCQIWIASFDMGSIWPEQASGLAWGEIAYKQVVASWSVILIARFLVTVVRWRDESLDRFDLPDDVLPAARRRQVWPVVNGHMDWPLPEPLAYDDWRNLITWAGAASHAKRGQVVGLAPRKGSRRP